jgi:multimeric flavodoxin WrbA
MKGYTQFLIDKIFQGAREAGAECESMTLDQQHIIPCIGCNVCQTEKHYLKCVFDDKDDVKIIFDNMRHADLIIFATPVYEFAMSSKLKTLLERIHSTADAGDLKVSRSGMFSHAIDQDLCSKPFVTLICYDNIEDATPKNVISYFDTYSKFMDSPCRGHLVRNAGILTGHGKNPDREKACPRIFQVYNAYVQAGRELATNGRISGSTLRKANQEVVPVPLFKYLKHIKFLKPYMISKARDMMDKR